MPATTLGKKAALAALADRRANQPEKMNNSRLPAGSPMYYYCVACGHLADTLPEGWFMHPPSKLCEECRALDELGWLE